MALDTAAWVAQATAALLDDAPAVEFVPVVPPALTFRQTHLPEYYRRLLAVYGAVAGWSRVMVVDLWPWVDWASVCFEREAVDAWRGALGEMERWTGVSNGD